MLSPLRNRFGIPGVISVIALVFAMLGGAYAASNNQSGKATASAKAKKGPRGPKGATGPAGPQGPAGPAGAKGDAGVNGAAGGVGPAGPAGPEGKQGKEGKAGKDGAEGSPWTAGGTLPPGETETGTWSIAEYGLKGNEQYPSAPISFPIPLSTTVKAVYLSKAETKSEAETEGCKWEQGNVKAKPEAPAGQLCVFTEEAFREEGVEGAFIVPAGDLASSGASPVGAFLTFIFVPPFEGSASLDMRGVWAVTAPSVP